MLYVHCKRLLSTLQRHTTSSPLQSTKQPYVHCKRLLSTLQRRRFCMCIAKGCLVLCKGEDVVCALQKVA